MSGIIRIGSILLAGGLVFRRLGRRRVQANVFVATAMGAARPSDIGLSFETLTLPLADHELQAWFVPAPNATASVLFFHGQHDALSSLVGMSQRLHNQNITVMVFNYSGHGQSTGKPTIERVRADCAAAYTTFRTKTGAEPKFVIGYSLGAAVLLDALHYHPMDVNGVVLASPFSSTHDVVIADGMPRALAWIVPNVYNNVRRIASVQHPVLIVHSQTDGTFPLSMAHRLHAANPKAELRVITKPTHGEVLATPTANDDCAEAYWQAVFDWMRRWS